MTTQKIDVFCPQCKAKLAVPTAALGKSGKCPHCQHVFPLAMPAPRPAAPASPLTPLSPAAPAVNPFSDLAPIGGSPLMPLGAPAPYAAPALAPLGGPDLMPLSDAGLSPLPAGSGLAPLGGSNPFAAPAPQDEYSLQPAAPTAYAPSYTLPSHSSSASEHLAAANVAYEEARQQRHYNASGDGDGWGINAGIGGGALMMLGAVVWFVVGLACGYIFFYPPILFVVGLVAFFKGIADNFSG